MLRTLRRAAITATALSLALALTACSSDSSPEEPGGQASVGAIPAVTDNGDGLEPSVAMPEGAAPTTLQVQDIKVGTGAEATADSTFTAHYLGVKWSDGQTFESSWATGQPLADYPLAGLIEGWKQGIPGMKVGGKRVLVIPPALAYGMAPGHPLEKETLIFVIELLDVK